jgi:hypothetical protein
MSSILPRPPLIQNLVARIWFLLPWRQFIGQQFPVHRKNQAEQILDLQEHASLLLRIAAALDKHP